MNLTERGLKLKYGAMRLLQSPSAYMVPQSVRQLIEEMANLIADMAHQIESQQPKE